MLSVGSTQCENPDWRPTLLDEQAHLSMASNCEDRPRLLDQRMANDMPERQLKAGNDLEQGASGNLHGHPLSTSHASQRAGQSLTLPGHKSGSPPFHSCPVQIGDETIGPGERGQKRARFQRVNHQAARLALSRKRTTTAADNRPPAN